MIFKTVSLFIWFLSYQINYTDKRARYIFVNPSKVIVNHIHNIFTDLNELVSEATKIINVLLQSLPSKQTVTIPNNLLLEPGVSACNILNFINLAFFADLEISDLNCLKNLLLLGRYDPFSWGAQAWQIIHFISYYMFIIQRNDTTADFWYRFLLNKLYLYLPCDLCSNHWVKVSESTDILEDNFERYKQVFTMHNRVRNDIGLHEYSADLFINNETSFYQKIFFDFLPN